MENLKIDQKLLELLNAASVGEPLQSFSEIQKRDLKKFTQISEVVRTYIRPQFERGVYLFKDGIREKRTFEVEYERLFSRTLDFYISHTNLSKKTGFSRSENYDQWMQLKPVLKIYVEQIVLPIMDTLPNIGEELYLFVYYWLLYKDEKLIVEKIIESEQTPPELVDAMYGMFFLLKKARDAADGKNEGLAYSYLLDVSHLIGMRDGATYASKHVPKAVRKVVSKKAKAAQTDAYGPCRQRVRELYAIFSKEPRPGGGRWFAKDLAIKILKALEQDAQLQGKKALLLKLSGITDMCEKLAKAKRG